MDGHSSIPDHVIDDDTIAQNDSRWNPGMGISAACPKTRPPQRQTVLVSFRLQVSNFEQAHGKKVSTLAGLDSGLEIPGELLLTR